MYTQTKVHEKVLINKEYSGKDPAVVTAEQSSRTDASPFVDGCRTLRAKDGREKRIESL